VIDPAVGFVLEKKVGDAVKAGEPILTVHYNDETLFERTRPRVLAAYRFGPRGPEPRPLVLERIEGA
jgi:pyrimidine-nucleoside phosphorylase